MDFHGGNIYKIKDGENMLDYSANINPLGIPQSLNKLIRNSIDKLINYPDPNYSELKEAISKFCHIDKNNILVGNGAVELIFLIIKSIKPKKTLILAPTFGEYQRALSLVGSTIDYLPYGNNINNYFTPVETIEKTIKNNNYDLLIICNPNNPSGHLTSLDEIITINNIAKEKNCKILIDEAFIDFLPDGEKISAKNLGDKNIFITRAFTKFYAIPGLRLGYSFLWDQDIIEDISSTREPWSINTFASLAGKVLLNDKKYQNDTYKWLNEEKIYFYRKLKEVEGVEVYKGQVNFILVKILNKNWTSSRLREELIKKGIIIRDCQNFEFLDNSYFRLAIKNRRSNEVVVEGLKDILNNKESLT